MDEVNRMTRSIRFVSAMSIAILLVIGSINAAEPEEPKEPAAAIVNGERIPMSALESKVQAAIRAYPGLRSKENIEALREMRKEILSDLISEELVIQEGIKAGLKPRDIEMSTELAKIRQRFPSDEAFQKTLKQENLTEKELHNIIERALIGKKVIDIKIDPTVKPTTDEEIAAFYEENKKQFVKPGEVKASHILIKVEPTAEEQEKANARSEMQAVLDKAKAGADFAELAKEFSQGPSGPGGGDLGYFGRGSMVKPFEDAAFGMEKGQISDIVETRFGYHIIMVMDKKPESPIKLEDVSENIRKELRARAVDAALRKWLEPVRKKATIKMMI